MSDSLRLFLIRHGETAWSITGHHTGLTDIALTAQIHPNPTSPLRLVRQSCELAGFGVAAVIEPDLVEWNYGDYAGKRTVDVQEDVSAAQQEMLYQHSAHVWWAISASSALNVIGIGLRGLTYGHRSAQLLPFRMASICR